MGLLFQVTCLLLLLNIISGGPFVGRFGEPFSSPFFSNPFGWHASTGPFDQEFNQMMEHSRQEFERTQAISAEIHRKNTERLASIKEKLAIVEPVCTTTPIENNTQKQSQPTKTTTCIKELILDGEKHTLKEVKVTDDAGNVISNDSKYFASSASSSSSSTSNGSSWSSSSSNSFSNSHSSNTK